TMEIPLVGGRDFTAADRDGAMPVAILSEAAAEALWPGQNPLGRMIRYAGRSRPGAPIAVVGIVGDVRHEGLDEGVTDRSTAPAVYHPYAQRPDEELTIV